MRILKSAVSEWRVGVPAALTASLVFTASGGAWAVALGSDPDTEINFDNTITYNLGARAQNIDPRIGNFPLYQNSDYKFPNKGDIVTNRLALFSEFDVKVRGSYGMRVSGSFFKDFAYDDKVEGNPAFGGAFTNRSDGVYGSDTKKYYLQGAELADAFAFANFDVAGRKASVKLGRTTVYWGNAFFTPFAGISYSQGPLDFIKAAGAPGTVVKELFMPRAQLFATVQLSDTWSLAGQYFLEFRPNRLPEGGTWLSSADLTGTGLNQIVLPDPTSATGMTTIPKGADLKPKNVHGNFGLALRYTPQSGSTLGLYARQFDEVMPWVALLGVGATGPEFHSTYAQKTRLLGVSYDVDLGGASTGFELSYRKNTALASASFGFHPDDLAGSLGPRGDVINVVANTLMTLPKSPFWDTGSLIAELVYTRLLKVTERPDMYTGVGYASCVDNTTGGAGNVSDGCSTRNALGLSVLFDPQWLQVLPSLDLDTPVNLSYGLIGNPALMGASGGAGGPKGTYSFSLGLHALYASKYNFTLGYAGSRGKGKAIDTPGGPLFVGGNGSFSTNDRDRYTFTFQTTF